MSAAEVRTNWAFRQAIIDWLTANGVDPKHVPPDSHATLVDGKLTLDTWYLIDGKHQLDPDREDELKRETVTVDVTVPPSPAVEFWLQPKCETCGR
jgi:hypothetical protein